MDDSLLSFLDRAVMYNRARFSPTEQSSSSENVEDLRTSEDGAGGAAPTAEGELLLEQVARCLANVALAEDDAGYRAIEHGSLKTLKIVTEHSSSYAAHLQSARALANFSSSGENVSTLSEGNFPS